MPQLNPSPWLAILIISWLVFLTSLPTKVMSHIFPNKMHPETKEGVDKTLWNWPWQH